MTDSTESVACTAFSVSPTRVANRHLTNIRKEGSQRSLVFWLHGLVCRPGFGERAPPNAPRPHPHRRRPGARHPLPADTGRATEAAGMPWPFVADLSASEADEVAAHAVMAIEALAGRLAMGGGR